MRSSGLERQLESLQHDVARLRDQLAVLDEQVAYVEAIADDATTRALVSSTPLADRERRSAEEDVRRTRAHRDEVAQRLADCRAAQDAALERMMERR